MRLYYKHEAMPWTMSVRYNKGDIVSSNSLYCKSKLDYFICITDPDEYNHPVWRGISIQETTPIGNFILSKEL